MDTLVLQGCLTIFTPYKAVITGASENSSRLPSTTSLPSTTKSAVNYLAPLNHLVLLNHLALLNYFATPHELFKMARDALLNNSLLLENLRNNDGVVVTGGMCNSSGGPIIIGINQLIPTSAGD